MAPVGLGIITLFNWQACLGTFPKGNEVYFVFSLFFRYRFLVGFRI